MSGQLICRDICAYYIPPAHIPAAPLRPMLHSSKRARGAQRANLKAAKQPRTAPPAQPVRNAVHDGLGPGMLSVPACGAPIMTTMVLIFKLEALPVVSSPGIVAAARATTFREARRALRCRFSTCHHDDLVMVVLPSVKGANDSCPGVTYLPRDQARTVIHES